MPGLALEDDAGCWNCARLKRMRLSVGCCGYDASFRYGLHHDRPRRLTARQTIPNVIPLQKNSALAAGNEPRRLDQDGRLLSIRRQQLRSFRHKAGKRGFGPGLAVQRD